MENSYDNTSSSKSCCAESRPAPSQADPEDPPPRDRIVKQTRFNPRKRLEQKMMQRKQKEAQNVSAEPPAMDIKRVSPNPSNQILSRTLDVEQAPRDKYMSSRQSPRDKYMSSRQPPWIDLTMKENVMVTSEPQISGQTINAPSSRLSFSEIPPATTQANTTEPPPRDRIVMPKRFNPRKRLEEKIRLRMQKEAQAAIAEPLPEEPKAHHHQLPVTQYAEQRLEKQNTVPRKSPRSDLMIKQRDLAISELQTPSQKISDDQRQFQTSYQTGNAENTPVHSKIPPQKPARKHLPASQAASAKYGPLGNAVPLASAKYDQLGKAVPPASAKHDQLGNAVPIAAAEQPLVSVNKPAVQAALDPFCTSFYVSGLNISNYLDFLQDKTAALVMFYEPMYSSCVKGRENFVKAAESNQRYNSAYAAVNCSVETNLCLKEKITTLPTFKLYSQGELVNIVKEHRFFNDRTMKKFVDDAPNVTQVGTVRSSCKAVQKLFKRAFKHIRPRAQ